MARRTAALTTTLLALAIVLTPALPAAAGGGCHGGATQGTGDTVELIDACFTPTVLRIEPGDDVTFVNRDGFTHNVTANAWGHFDDLDYGDGFTATFAGPGVYPYACTYHPGMSGAIVVGDGTGAGNGETVAVASFEEPAPPSPVVEVRTVSERSGSPQAVGWVVGGSIGLALGIGIGVLVRRRARSAA